MLGKRRQPGTAADAWILGDRSIYRRARAMGPQVIASTAVRAAETAALAMHNLMQVLHMFWLYP
jgi:hypothetical protein